jgi:hypothetical protein
MPYSLNAVCRAGAVLALCLAAGCKFKNNPPDTPAMPTGPTEVFTNSNASYVSSAADPDGDSVYLCFSSDGAGYGSTNWSSLVASGDTASWQFTWYNSGTYRLRVRALDQHGYYSDWSQWLTITVEEPAGRRKEEFRQGPDTKKESQ